MLIVIQRELFILRKTVVDFAIFDVLMCVKRLIVLNKSLSDRIGNYILAASILEDYLMN